MTDTAETSVVARLSALEARLSAVEARLDQALLSSATPDPSRHLARLDEAVAEVRAGLTTTQASVAGVRAVADAAARTAASRVTRADLDALHDGTLQGVAVILNERSTAAKTSTAALTAELRRVAAGSPADAARNAISSALRAWAA